MKSLPQFQTDDRDFQLMQSSWASALAPLLNSPVCAGILLKGVDLAAADNVVNHRLGRTPQGWSIMDIDAPAVIYRSAAFTDKTLTLNSDAVCRVTLFVF